MSIQLELFNKAKEKWIKSTQESATRDYNFDTLSGESLDSLYYPKVPTNEYLEKLGFPGQYPYTRGVHANMYRGKLWTRRQFSGFGTPKETNERYHSLLSKGQTGLSVAFDMPTLMGYNPGHEWSEGEVGKCGVSISSIKDMEALFDGINLGEISVSMTINGPAIILLAFYIAAAENQKVPLSKLRGTLQNDILKEFMVRNTYIYPPKPSMRIISDIFQYTSMNMPKFNSISISGYHMQEAGASADLELAYTIADGLEYVKAGIKAGIDIDAFAPRLSFFWAIGMDYFMEIAKMRAGRLIWANLIREFKPKDPRSLALRTHCQTSGWSLTAQDPLNNITRTCIEALAATHGHTQSLHTNSFDEAIALPTDFAAEIALRTQQLLAFETGVANVADPLGGSWFIESLTDQIEQEAEKYFGEIESIGGVIPAIESGYFQREISIAASNYQRKIDDKKLIHVG